jgi:hypothetical protein
MLLLDIVKVTNDPPLSLALTHFINLVYSLSDKVLMISSIWPGRDWKLKLQFVVA